MNEKNVLAIAAHPDDVEFMMAGTLLLLRDRGYRLHMINIADGCCGSTRTDAATTARIRWEEAKEAAGVLEAVIYPPLCRDLEIFYQLPLLRKLTAVVRRVRPTIVLTHSPEDYMEDHTNTCRLAVTATFSRGIPNFESDPPTEPWYEAVTVYHAMPHGLSDSLGRPIIPTHYVDISGVLEKKRRALACHRSQRDWLDDSQGMDNYLETMVTMAAEMGRRSGTFSYAEGWRKHLHWGFCSAADDPLRETLGDGLVRIVAAA
jgi:LmbE family N-acetylglucosaminyl deacetylase